MEERPGRKQNAKNLTIVWENQFLKAVKLCSETIPGEYVKLHNTKSEVQEAE